MDSEVDDSEPTIVDTVEPSVPHGDWLRRLMPEAVVEGWSVLWSEYAEYLETQSFRGRPDGGRWSLILRA